MPALAVVEAGPGAFDRGSCPQKGQKESLRRRVGAWHLIGLVPAHPASKAAAGQLSLARASAEGRITPPIEPFGASLGELKSR